MLNLPNLQIQEKSSKKGFEARKRTLRSVIIHTTNGKFNSSYQAELQFLRTSNNVGAHYLVGKEGQITQLLDPKIWAAWHTGLTFNPYDSNQYTVGVECHFTPGEKWTIPMWQALTDLCKALKLPLKTHREIAFPKGRKIDPSGVTDTWFNAWKNNLYLSKVYTARTAVIRSAPTVNYATIAKNFSGDVFGFWVTGQFVRNSNQWLQTPDGFIHISGVI